jgi:hypothetical protein
VRKGPDAEAPAALGLGRALGLDLVWTGEVAGEYAIVEEAEEERERVLERSTTETSESEGRMNSSSEASEDAFFLAVGCEVFVGVSDEVSTYK